MRTRILTRILSILLLLPAGSAMAQMEVIVTPVITPPYSPYLADYQEKAIIQLQNTTAENLSLKLTGRIEGDNGYVLFTRPDYLPAAPILLEPFESKTIFVATDAEDFLDPDNLETNVPDRVRRNIIGAGLLPEGNYSFCVEAVEYPGGRQLSAQAPAGCIPISISYPTPPVLMAPICEATVEEELPVFSWTPPIGNTFEAMLVYDLYVVPLQPEENPFEAMDRAFSYQGGNPIIFRDLSLPFYSWQPFDLPLEPGRTYAVQIVARDLNQRVVFQNSGRSPVCTFTMSQTGLVSTGNMQDVQSTIQNFPSAQVSGQLLYRFPGRGQEAPTESGPQFELGNPSMSDIHAIVPHQPLDYSQPILIDPYPVNASGANPLANITVKLVVRYLYKLPHTASEEPQYLAALYGNPANGASPTHPFNPDMPEFEYYNGQVLSVTQTDENGNFHFNFIHLDSLLDLGVYNNGIGTAFSGGSTDVIDATAGGTIEIDNVSWNSFEYTGFYQVLRVEVESPYFCSPDMSIIIQPGQSIELPQLVSLVKSYRLTVQTMASDTENQQATANDPLEGMEVEVMRSLNQPITYEVPENEGQDLGETEIVPPGFSFRILSRGETDANGKVTFYNLVKHPISTSGKYLLRARSPDSYTAYSYITTVVNYPPGDGIDYSSQPKITPYVNGNGIYPISLNTNNGISAIFNSAYAPPSFETTIVMEPNDPVVFGRAVHDIIGLPDVQVSLLQNGQVVDQDLTDDDGYFEFKELQPGNNYQVKLYRYGYETTYAPADPFSLQPGTFKDLQEIQMIPKGLVYGYVTNENDEPILADVRLADSPWYPTELTNSTSLPVNGGAPLPANVPQSINATQIVTIPQMARFLFPAQSGKALPLIIDPYSDQYFADTISVTVLANQSNPQFLGTFTLTEKLHRPRFVVKDENGNPVNGAKVTIQDQEKITGHGGLATIIFASPAEEFLVRIDPPSGSNLVPYQQILVIPISKDPITIPVELQFGQSISGLVTAGPDSIPLAGARVFLDEYLVWEYELPLIETFTDENGNYTLHGLPEEYIPTAAGGTVPVLLTIRAVKSEPGTAYIGDMKKISVPRTTPVNFHLETLENTDLSQIWGFPVEIEEAEQLANGQWEFSGSFIDLPSNGNFGLLQPESRLDFSDLPTTMTTGSDGLLHPDPIPSRIALDQAALPVRIMDNFQGTLNPTTNNPVELGIREESPGQGVLEGQIYLDLASFAFSYDYHSDLYLGESPNDPDLVAFRPATVSYPRKEFSLMDLVNPRTGGQTPADPSYRVHEFYATADRQQSYLREDTVALFTVLHTNIELSDPPDLNIQAGFIRVLPTDILPFEQGEELSFMLEAWEIQANSGWYYDKSNGGIHIPTATIKTGALDVPVKDIVVRYDDIDVGSLNMNQRAGNKLSIAGVADLDLMGNEPVFYLDNMVPTDLQPHWRIKVSGSNGNPAAKTDIPEFSPGQITFESFSLISNGEQYLVVEDQTVWIYGIMEFDLHNIITSYNYFTLTGEADLHIPEVPSNSGVFKFSKPADEIVMEFEHFEVGVDGQGQVEFIDSNNPTAQQFSPGQFVALGTIRAYDDDGSYIDLQGRLIRTANSCQVEVIQVNGQNQHIVCGGTGSNTLEVIQGTMPADLQSNTWLNFEFDAYPRSNKGLADNTGMLHFVVVGDFQADNSSISVTDLSTPFGDLTLIFNLSDQSLTAGLHIGPLSEPGFNMGIVSIYEADLNFYMGNKGFYFLLAAWGEVPIVGRIDVITLAGHYTEFNSMMSDIWDDYTFQEIPDAFANGFSGFIFNGKWQPVNASAGFDVIPEVIYLDFYASILVEVRIYADFGEDDYEFSVLGRGEFMLAFSGPCFDTGVGLVVEILLGARVSNANFDLFGCASVSLLGYYKVCAPVQMFPPPAPPECLDSCASDCWNGGVKVELIIGESVGGIDMEVDLGGGTCSGEPMQIDKVVEDLGIDCD